MRRGRFSKEQIVRKEESACRPEYGIRDADAGSAMQIAEAISLLI